jgi:hypothetical protein
VAVVVVQPSALRTYMRQHFKHFPNNFRVTWIGGFDKGKGYLGVSLKADVRGKLQLVERGAPSA